MSPDDLVRVAGGRNQAEAEYIQNILRDEGIPSMERRARGFDLPEFLAAGPRDVMVMATRLDEAREVLEAAGLDPSHPSSAGPDPVKLFAGVAGSVLVVGAIVLVFDALA